MIPAGYESLIPPFESVDRQPGSQYPCIDGSNGKKGNALWKKVRCQLVEYHSLPGYLKDNEYILGYYRADWPLKQAFLSIFKIHNETLNVWTHLLGFFLFLFLTIRTATKIPEVVDYKSLQILPDLFQRADFHRIRSDLVNCLPSIPNMPDIKASLISADFLESLSGLSIWEVLASCMPETLSRTRQPARSESDVANLMTPSWFHPITRWPFFAFMGGVMFCLLSSSICHLLSCHSQRVSYIVHRIDYAGIAVLIATSFYPPVYYSFMCNPFVCNLYLGFITLLGVATAMFSLVPAFGSPKFRSCRAALYFGMGVSGVAPILHKLILFGDRPEVIQTTGYEVAMGMFYGVGALIYATRVPERWKPGKFDIAGQSHQLFHVLVVAGAFTHYQAGVVYLKWRDQNGC